MISIKELTTNLILDADGIWSSSKNKSLSYPEDGNAHCFQLEDSSYWFQHRNQVLSCVVKRYPPNGAIFDIGGGNGCVAKKLEEGGHEIVLIEPGRLGALNARRRGLINVICSTMEDAGFTNDSLPAVGLFDVLEHIEHDVAFLQKIRQLLVHRGMVYITVPAFTTLWSQEDVFAGHYRRYTLKSIASTLEKAGLHVVYSSYFFSFLTIPVFLLRSIPSRIGLRKQSKNMVTEKEHKQPSGLGGWYVNRARKKELNCINTDGTLYWGSSCLVVARAD